MLMLSDDCGVEMGGTWQGSCNKLEGLGNKVRGAGY
jgi:hypothetical protein